ncbi:MAG TPA: glycosyltransferase [Solirubrobacteraceae bacterium]
MTDVSVIVAARDAAHTLGACLDSLLALDHPSYEVLVVDNASSDATRTVASRRAGVRVLDEPRLGPAAARNTGLQAARGSVVAFTDADCVADPAWLAELLRALDGRDDRVAGGRILATRPANYVERFGERVHDHQAALMRYDPPYAITMSWAMATPPAGARRVFDEALLRGSDTDLSWRLHAAGWSFAYAPDAVIYHRNERTLRGLFAEGFTHGRHGERVRDKHGIVVPRRRPKPPRSLPEAVFRLGTAAGRRL